MRYGPDVYAIEHDTGGSKRFQFSPLRFFPKKSTHGPRIRSMLWLAASEPLIINLSKPQLYLIHHIQHTFPARPNDRHWLHLLAAHHPKNLLVILKGALAFGSLQILWRYWGAFASRNRAPPVPTSNPRRRLPWVDGGARDDIPHESESGGSTRVDPI